MLYYYNIIYLYILYYYLLCLYIIGLHRPAIVFFQPGNSVSIYVVGLLCSQVKGEF